MQKVFYPDANILNLFKGLDMTTTAIRQLLLNYLAEAEDDKIKAIYTLLKGEIGTEDVFTLTEEQYQILDNERALHLSGKSKSYSREEARQLIRG